MSVFSGRGTIWLRQASNLTELCSEFGISRQTGHKWLHRYRELGPLGLVEQSRRPDSTPSSTGEDVVLAILELRNQHPSWGPDKISRVLIKRFGAAAPSKSTVARALRRVGKVKRRRPPVRIWTDGRPHVEVAGPDDLWTMDFKGRWRARNGQKCEPFTVRDAYSRFLLAARLLPNSRGAGVRRVLEELFSEYGIPRAISHQLTRHKGSSQTRRGADDFPDEGPDDFADEFADYFRDDFRRRRRREQLNTSLICCACLSSTTLGKRYKEYPSPEKMVLTEPSSMRTTSSQ